MTATSGVQAQAPSAQAPQAPSAQAPQAPAPTPAPAATEVQSAVLTSTTTEKVVPKTPTPSTVTPNVVQDVVAPAPLSYLISIFQKSELGKCALEKPLRCSFSKPEQECIDAYDLNAVRAIRNGAIELLREMVNAGKSLNACNRFGESLMHMACRRGDVTVVKFLVEECHVRVDVRDDFGRTPLHDACWTSNPNFDVMDLLIRSVSPRLLLAEDVRGHSPFHYARKEHWPKWVEFLKERDALLLQRLLSIQVIG